MKQRSIVKRRPAESAAATAASIVGVLALLGVEVPIEAVTSIVIAVGFLPALVTAIVDRVRSL